MVLLASPPTAQNSKTLTIPMHPDSSSYRAHTVASGKLRHTFHARARLRPNTPSPQRAFLCFVYAIWGDSDFFCSETQFPWSASCSNHAQMAMTSCYIIPYVTSGTSRVICARLGAFEAITLDWRLWLRSNFHTTLSQMSSFDWCIAWPGLPNFIFWPFWP